MASPQPDDEHEVVRVRDGVFVFITYSLGMAFYIAIPLLEVAFKNWVVSVGLGIAGGCAFTLILTGAVLWGEPPPPTLRGKFEWFFTALTKSPRGKLDTCSEWGPPRHDGGDEEEAAPEPDKQLTCAERSSQRRGAMFHLSGSLMRTDLLRLSGCSLMS